MDRSASSWDELRAAPGVLVESEGTFGWVRRTLTVLGTALVVGMP